MSDQNETSTVWASAELELPTDLPTDLLVLLVDLRGLCRTYLSGRFMKVLETGTPGSVLSMPLCRRWRSIGCAEELMLCWLLTSSSQRAS